MNQLYKNIRSRRLQLGMSQEELAQKVGYTDRTSIAKIEAGKVDLSESKIFAFAEALKTTPAILSGWESDEELAARLAASAAPLEQLSDPVEALNVFLYRIGERIIKVHGKHYLSEAGELSDDDLQFLLDTAVGSLRPAVEMLKKRAERDLRRRLAGETV